MLIFSLNFGEFDKCSLVFAQIFSGAQILPDFLSKSKEKQDFCRIFAIRPRRNVQGTGRVPGGYPGGFPQFAFSRKLPHTAPPKKLAPAAPLGRSPTSRSPRLHLRLPVPHRRAAAVRPVGLRLRGAAGVPRAQRRHLSRRERRSLLGAALLRELTGKHLLTLSF